MQIQNASGNDCCFEETGRHGSKVNADWITDGISDSFDATSNKMILSDLTLILIQQKVMRENCQQSLQR